MHIEPRRPAIRCEILNRQLKIWRSRKINGCHAEKLLRLWLGYDFLDLMDDYGRIIRRHFNEVRRRLKYEQSSDMLAEIRSSQSFYIVGNSEEDILAICSPVWHQYGNQEGMLLSGSIPIDESEIQSGILTHNIDNHNIDNPNGVTAEAVSLERDREAKRKIVRNYFEWLQRQTDSDHASLVAEIRNRIQLPKDKHNQVIQEKRLDDEQTDQVLEILFRQVMPEALRTREKFFDQSYMAHPEKRVWWMKNLFRNYGKGHLVHARKKWERQRLAIESETARRIQEAEMQYRPLSPHEWQDAAGQRLFVDPKGRRMTIPADFPPRPSDSCFINTIDHCWFTPEQ